MAKKKSQHGSFKKYLAVVLLLMLFFTISAEKCLSYKAIVFKLNGSELFPQGITVSSDKVTVYGIPESTDYNYLLMILKDSSGAEVYRKVASGNRLRRACFVLGYLPVGSYTMGLYHSPEQDSFFEPDIEDDLTMIKMSDQWTFSESPALAINLQQASKERNDDNALSFYLRPTELIQSTDPAIAQLSADLTRDYEDSYSKALAIHDWVCNNIFYDYDALYGRIEYQDYSATGVLKSRLTVCEGYANLTIALLQAAGIPAKIVSGYAVGVEEDDQWPQGIYDGSFFEPNHAWVEAYIGEHWAILDPTWDSVNAYEYGEVTSSSGLSTYRYFDVSQELFALDHVVVKNNNFNSIYLYTDYPQVWSHSVWKSIDTAGTVPVIQEGRVLVPVRVIIEEMGGTIHWQKGTKTFRTKVTCNVNGHNIQMWINYRTFYVDGKEYTFDIAPQVIDGRIMIPVRGMFEAIGCRVRWDSNVDNWAGRVTIDYLY